MPGAEVTGPAGPSSLDQLTKHEGTDSSGWFTGGWEAPNDGRTEENAGWSETHEDEYFDIGVWGNPQLFKHEWVESWKDAAKVEESAVKSHGRLVRLMILTKDHTSPRGPAPVIVPLEDDYLRLQKLPQVMAHFGIEDRTLLIAWNRDDGIWKKMYAAYPLYVGQSSTVLIRVCGEKAPRWLWEEIRLCEEGGEHVLDDPRALEMLQ
ncbi:hypothetical protein NM688_g1422 [Phlebia brevispora]|uniref:Uncharacterized protein n=1 Tax=Phlebia brevispora TaxID=194682 RepID=A0ACC1TBT3_9APHY|nr:hypothetical protein NM688_g1422 [Phlebia brevispora]